MPGTHPETTIPASAPGESAPLSAKTTPIEPPSTVNPVIMASSRRESIANRNPSSSPTCPFNAHNHNFKLESSTGSLDGIKSDDDDPVTIALKQFVSDDRHFSLIRNFRLADLITIFNGVCGSLSIFSSAYFLITLDLKHLERACLFPILSLAFDFLDGKVARFRNESSVLGQELDSLADLISFGVAPALVGFTIGLRHPTDILILTFFVCAGLARLARFNSTAAFNQSHHHHQQQQQLPSTSSIKSNENNPLKSNPPHRNSNSNSFEGLPIPTSLWLVAGMYESIRRAQIELNSWHHYILSQENQSLLSTLNINQASLNWLRKVQLNGNQLIGGLVKNSWGIRVHWFSLAFAGWGFLMLSKTLKIPKL